MTGFADEWDPELMMSFHSVWQSRNYLAGAFVDVEDLTSVVDSVLQGGASVSLHSVTVAPRPTSERVTQSRATRPRTARRAEDRKG